MHHVPWDRRLGAGRVFVELAEALGALGHRVEHFSWEDAYPRPPRIPGSALLLQDRFASKAAAYVRANAGRFDVIDARETDLPYSAADLGVRGIVCARSVGLHRHYAAWELEERVRWPGRPMRREPMRTVANLKRHRENARNAQALLRADLVMLPNEEEQASLNQELGIGGRCIVLPYGFHDDALARLRAVAERPRPRPQIAFIGTWQPRKGALDWAAIASTVLQKRPDARFHFLGTRADKMRVMRDLPGIDHSAVDVTPTYTPDELPELLADARVAALPSYAEGCPFAVLEQLAAGLPVVAYDAAGARDMLYPLRDQLLVPPGITSTFADRIARVLALEMSEWRQLSAACASIAAEHRWSTIAMQTADAYTMALASAGRQ